MEAMSTAMSLLGVLLDLVAVAAIVLVIALVLRFVLSSEWAASFRRTESLDGAEAAGPQD